jgi:hypothetical protein
MPVYTKHDSSVISYNQIKLSYNQIKLSYNQIKLSYNQIRNIHMHNTFARRMTEESHFINRPLTF